MREAAAFTQSALAEKLEVETISISRLETENTLVNLPLALKISEIWAIEMMWLAAGRGPIFATVPGVHIIGNIDSYAPCRAALQLLAASPAILDVALIECHEPYLGPVYGWIFLQQGWTNCLGIVLPGEEKPGQMTSALTGLVAQRHRFRGAYSITSSDYDTLKALSEEHATKKFRSFYTNKELVDYWHKKLRQKPTRLRIDEALERLLTPDIRETLERAFTQEESDRQEEAPPTPEHIAAILAQHNNTALNKEVLALIRSHNKPGSKWMARRLKNGA
jgi:DNA-binding XRE family transcriptional regulator